LARTALPGTPLARLSIRVTPKIRWNAGWQFYNYHELFGLTVPMQNYRANTGYTSVLWSFRGGGWKRSMLALC
jgi:hypothetical protein